MTQTQRGQRLRRERMKRKLSTAELAAVLGRTVQAVRRLERGVTEIAIDDLAVLLSAWGPGATLRLVRR